MSDGLLIADSGPLIALAKLALLDLPKKIYGNAAMPATVYRECQTQLRLPDAQLIERAIQQDLISVIDDVTWPEAHPKPHLDLGETAAISLAIKLHAHLLIDELRGRRIATRLGIPVVGVCGLLLVAKQRSIIDALTPKLDQLRESGYFISPQLRQAVVIAADEVV